MMRLHAWMRPAGHVRPSTHCPLFQAMQNCLPDFAVVAYFCFLAAPSSWLSAFRFCLPPCLFPLSGVSLAPCLAARGGEEEEVEMEAILQREDLCGPPELRHCTPKAKTR